VDAFELALRTRLVCGRGALERLGSLARELAPGSGATRVLLVTDPGLVASGHVQRAEGALRAAGCELARFDETREDPTSADVERCSELARGFRPQLFVGLGGGSAIDAAKGADFLLTNGGRMADYRGYGRTSRPLLPLIAVPTTAGTGSEVQSYALIADQETQHKMACGAADAAPRVALLDPELTVTQPFFVSACTGLDAIGHALESAVTRRRNAFSDLFAREALRLAASSFPAVLRAPHELEGRAAMQLAATCAGLAIECSMLGAAHSMANPLSARYGLAHGQAVGTCLPHVVRFNAEDPATRARYAQLSWSAGLCGRESGEDAALAALLSTLESFLVAARIDPALSSAGLVAADVPALAEQAAGQWTAQFNPRPVGAAEFERLYRAAAGT
jgi:alcohol dehydrogenase